MYRLILICMMVMGNAVATEPLPTIDLETIAYIESSNNPNAYNKGSQARGLYQITPILLKEYNQYNKTTYTKEDLFDVEINTKIAKWYFLVRIPQMLKYYEEQITIENLLISYNAGIKYVVDKLELPKETKNYIKKYKKGVIK